MSSLRAAASAAVENNRLLVGSVVEEVRTLVADLRPASRPDDDGDLARQERALLAEAATELTTAADDLVAGADTFNIVLFGRTGVGKSTLLEALTHGDGAAVSPGESDWTTEVTVVGWEDCRLIDTPGIQGWGRTRSRADLEELARRALIAADVVLLCFDSFNQQAGEFEKVADWLAEYRKPTIAVLNVRSHDWRMPTRVPLREVRVDLSTTVLEHAGHIGDELSGVGLRGTPLVALHAQRAMYGRAPGEFRGPRDQAVAFGNQRERHGPDNLVGWSNLPVLEGLLGTAIELGADRLRRDTVLNQVVHLLRRWSAQLRAATAEPAEAAAVGTERGIEQMLAILGAPEAQLDIAVGGADSQEVAHLVERLGELERLRGGGFFAPARGSAHRHGATALDAALGPLRSQALRRAEDLVDSGMEDRRTIGEDEFREHVFDADAIRSVLDEVVAEMSEYLRAKVGLAAGDVEADLRAVLTHGARVRGTAGRGMKVASYGTIATLTVAGLLNLWNPVGWGMLAAGAAMGLTVAAGLAAPGLRTWLRRRGVGQRNAELARARGAARRAVSETFDTVRDEASAWLADTVRRGLTSRLTAVVDDAIDLRNIARAAEACARSAEAAADRIGRLAGPVGPADSAASILQDAMRIREDADVPPGSTRRSLWLGEQWCDDPTGLDEVPSAPRAPQQEARRSGRVGQVLDRLSHLLAQVTAVPRPGSGRDWLADTARLLDGDAHAAPLLAELQDMAGEPSPIVVVFGDYNVGKSSFIARLLVDDGQPVPSTLTVRARPETAEVERYPWSGLTLVDTPGLQSGRAEHSRRARAGLADAALVLHLVGSAVTGDSSGLDLVLHGDPERGLVPKLDRTLFVVNRVDALGVHPRDDEVGFARLVRRRETELHAALEATAARRGTPVAVDPARILSVASDPDGRLTSGRAVTRADFDAHRDWDGMDQLRRAIEEFRPRLRANSVDVSVLHGGLARLGALAAAARTRAEDLRKRVVQRGRLGDDVRSAQQDAVLIERTSRAELVATVTGFLSENVEAALSADRLSGDVLLEQAARFAQHPELAQLIDEWRDRTQRRVAQWAVETTTVLQRRVRSQAFIDAVDPAPGESSARFDDSLRVSAGEFGRAGSALMGAVQFAQRLRAAEILRAGSEQAARMMVLQQFHMRSLGGSDLSGWLLGSLTAHHVRGQAVQRATTLTRNASRLGAVVQVATGVVDAALLYRDLRMDRMAELQRIEAIQGLRADAASWAEGVVDAHAGLAALRYEEAEIAALLDEADGELTGDRAALVALEERIARYDKAMEAGMAVLRTGGRDGG